jgi:hypothetical protein
VLRPVKLQLFDAPAESLAAAQSDDAGLFTRPGAKRKWV